MLEQLEELESLFSYRYTDADEEFTRTMSTPLADPPIVDNWYKRPKRQWDWTRGGRGGGRGRGGYDNRGGYNNRGRGGYDNRGGYNRGRGGYDNHYSERQYNNPRDRYGGNDDSYNRDRNQYGNRGGYNHNQQRGGHYGGERNQGSGHYGADRNRQGGNHENSGPSRTIYAGKMEDRQSHYPDRHRPYGNRPQRGRGGPPQQ